MKFNHNKKRNTAFIYEILINEITKSSMNSDTDRKNLIVSILREHFSKNMLLKKELEIYNSFKNLDNLGDNMVHKLLEEAKRQYKLLDRNKIFAEQTKLISKINKHLGSKCWENFIPSYKMLATTNQVLTQNLNPKKQVMLEAKFLKNIQDKDKKSNPFPNVNNLAMRTFVEAFNKKYSDNLNDKQKLLIEKFIMSHSDDGVSLKLFLYQEIDRLKNNLSSHSNLDEATSQGIQKVLEKINSYSNKVIDSQLITEVVKIQALVEEL